MVDENAPTQEPAAAASPRRSRRSASRPAGPPPAREGLLGAESAEAPATTAAGEESAEPVVDAPEPRRRARRATRGVTTVAFSAEAVEEPVVATSAADAPTMAVFQPPEQTPPARRRRSRAPREEAAAEPAADAPEQEAGTATAEAEQAPEVRTEDVADEVADEVAEEAVEEAVGDEAADATDPDSDDDDEPEDSGPRRRRRRGGRRRRRSGQSGADRAEDADEEATEESAEDERPRRPRAGAEAPDGRAEDDEAASVGEDADDESDESADGSSSGSRRRRRRRRRAGVAEEMEDLSSDESVATVVKVRDGRARGTDEISSVRGSTRIEAKKQRRRDGRDAGRRRAPILTEAEFLARRESVNRVMCVREHGDRTQIAVLEDGILVEHYVNRAESSSMVGNVYLGKVQNVLPSMEAAFVDIGRGRNAVLYAGEVNWDAAGLEGQPKRIELALKSGDAVLVQVTKDPIGHKGARLTSQISLPGRFLVYVPEGSMTGISRKLPDTERARLKGILKDVVPEGAGVIVRTAAEGAAEDQLTADVTRLTAQWTDIQKKAKSSSAPALLYGEPDLAIKVVRDIFNEDFTTLYVQGETTWQTLNDYIGWVAPDLLGKLQKWVEPTELYSAHRIDEQLAKALDRKVWLPSGGSLVIDRTEAMTVIDVNTGKFTGQGGNLEETVTRNNLEAAEEIVRQLRLRDIGGIIVVDFIDMVLQSNRDLVLRRLVECLGRDRTKHQVAEVTSLGLVQMTRKRIGQGLIEVFSTTCEACGGRGHIVSSEPVDVEDTAEDRGRRGERNGRRSSRKAPVNLGGKQTGKTPPPPKFDEQGHPDHDHYDHDHDDHDHDEHEHDDAGEAPERDPAAETPPSEESRTPDVVDQIEPGDVLAGPEPAAEQPEAV
jgi:ribonuclease E